jgi:hypothetical protein
MRADLGTRYDSSLNMIDWDYHMLLGDLAPILKFPEYRMFRTKGLSWDLDCVLPAHSLNPRPPTVYSAANRTLLHFDKRGLGYYAGDIKNSPFACFGVETENPNIVIRDHDGTYKLGAQILSFHNVRSYLFEFVTGRPWVFTPHYFLHDKSEDEIRAHLSMPNPNHHQITTEDANDVPKLDVMFVFGTLDISTLLKRLERQKVQLHVAYISVMTGIHIQKALINLIHPRCKFVAETGKFILDFTDDQRELYTNKLITLANECGGWVEDELLTTELNRHQLREVSKEGDIITPAKEKRRKRMQFPAALVFTRATPKAEVTAQTNEQLIPRASRPTTDLQQTTNEMMNGEDPQLELLLQPPSAAPSTSSALQFSSSVVANVNTTATI